MKEAIMSEEERKTLKQNMLTARQQALCQQGYANLDLLYAVHEPLRQLYGPDIIQELEEL